jgi:hypothetical protein
VLAGQQATDQVLRQAQLSSYQYNQAMIQGAPAQMNYENLCCFLTESPKFSVKPGKYNEPRTVEITDSTAGATIYYTTDGWTRVSMVYRSDQSQHHNYAPRDCHFSAHRAKFCDRRKIYD